MSLPVAILAGGLATRLRPLTEGIPKVLLEVAGSPFAVHQIELLKRNGIRRVVFCVGHFGDQVQAALGDGRRWGLEIEYSFDGPALLGTGGALQQALPRLGKSFFILYGDSYLDCDYAHVAQTFLKSGKLGLMTVFRNQNQWDKSNVIFSDGLIRRYDKRQRCPEMLHIDYGLGVLRAEVFGDYSNQESLDLATLYEDLVTKNELAGYEVTKRFYEIGSIPGLEELRQHLAKTTMAHSSSLD